MEPQERGRGEGKEEGRGERRIMAELLTPWTAKEDFLWRVRRREGQNHRTTIRHCKPELSHLGARGGDESGTGHSHTGLKHDYGLTLGVGEAAI